ncbi:MAG: Fic family protein [Capsulimonadaceae bacterium]|nr:Fic family protein [Capsulimonadaceae bacterium]
MSDPANNPTLPSTALPPYDSPVPMGYTGASPLFARGIVRAGLRLFSPATSIQIDNSSHHALIYTIRGSALAAWQDCAVLGHFVFVYIHPYPDGNGRIARFIMNAALASGGYPWTVIRNARRDEYLAALEGASTGGGIGRFARFVREEMEGK